MEILVNIINKLNDSLNINNLMNHVLIKRNVNEYIVFLNKQQLLLGKDAIGDDLMRYVDDPFFKSMNQAIAYQNWKSKISPNKSKNVQVMDFYINGYFHNSIDIDIFNDSLNIFSNTDIEVSFENKTHNQGFGLNDYSRIKLFEYIKPLLLKRIWELMK